MKPGSPVVAAFLFVIAGSAVRANPLPVDVTYTITGQPGAWLLDFTLSNNIPGVSGTGLWPVNYFGVDLPNATITGNPSPPCFIDNPINPFICGTDYVWLPWNYFNNLQGTRPDPLPFPAYNDFWYSTGPTFYFVSRIGGPYPLPGSGLSGFTVLDTDAKAPLSVSWVAQAYNFYQPYGDLYTGGGNLNPDTPATLPVFEGTAAAPTATPEPASFVFMAVAFAGVLVWRRKRGAAAPCAADTRM